ncbi:MAG: YidC/Oxa1 family insertase periplasmic-domain containing protein, partial [Planctomycetota bacterium]
MPASKQSGALKVALPLLAVLLFSAFIFGPALFAPKNAQQQNQQPQQQADTGDAEARGSETADAADGANEDITEPVAQNDSEEQPAPIEPAPDVDEVAETTPLAADTGAPAIAPAPSGPGVPNAWSVRTMDAGAGPSTIGSFDPASGYELEVEIDPAGVGIDRATFANHYNTAKQAQDVRAGVAPEPEWHYEVTADRLGSGGQTSVHLFMVDARAVYLQDPTTGISNTFDLTSDRVWEQTAPGAYRATVLDAQGDEAVAIERRFVLETDTYDIRVEQTVRNLTGADLRMVWYQYGPTDLPPETAGYRIETRRVRVAHTLGSDDQLVRADSEVRDLPKVFKLAQNQPNKLRQIWGDDAYSDPGAFAWVAQTNRHFMFVVHPELDADEAERHTDDPDANPLDKSFRLGAGGVFAEGLLSSTKNFKEADAFDKHVEIAMQSDAMTLRAGATADISFGVYLGPLDDRYLGASNDVRYGAMNLGDAVIYQIGYCGVCTFQWIAKPLLGLIRFFQGNVVFDWGIAIILLVICVRVCLHPITKKSQVSMMRFGKQMQSLAPKQQKIKERYKDDRQRMNQELAKLMREEQINPLGMLGCLPMLLQSPIWIALYATIYFAFDLRHEPAFFGVFQQMGGWSFLNDLSSPDHFIDFGRPLFTIPLMGAISGFNILPILM